MHFFIHQQQLAITRYRTQYLEMLGSAAHGNDFSPEIGKALNPKPQWLDRIPDVLLNRQ